ncbi:MAG: SDR family oxidoreductase [Gammaproteobacteria bacterium]|nr:SDR family oxidoreductase [Gammaproteobacteria bacterium]
MKKRVALITGSTSGIGAAIARRLAEEGVSVALHSKTSVGIGEALAKELPGASYTQADLSNEQDTRLLVATVLATHGQLDILVNNAGISEVIPHSDLRAATSEVWQRLYAVNVIAPWVLITEAEQALRAAAERGASGCIVNISSHAGVRPKGASIPYAVSKAALNHMTKLLSVTLAPQVRVNAIAPGLVDTPMTQSWQAAQELWRDRAPMRRGASPEEIADVACMLVNSSYLTGEVIIADGGLNLT